jgi:hypothetical protein
LRNVRIVGHLGSAVGEARDDQVERIMADLKPAPSSVPPPYDKWLEEDAALIITAARQTKSNRTLAMRKRSGYTIG